jgi:hypothetical protein
MERVDATAISPGTVGIAGSSPSITPSLVIIRYRYYPLSHYPFALFFSLWGANSSEAIFLMADSGEGDGQGESDATIPLWDSV